MIVLELLASFAVAGSWLGAAGIVLLIASKVVYVGRRYAERKEAAEALHRRRQLETMQAERMHAGLDIATGTGTTTVTIPTGSLGSVSFPGMPAGDVIHERNHEGKPSATHVSGKPGSVLPKELLVHLQEVKGEEREREILKIIKASKNNKLANSNLDAYTALAAAQFLGPP